MLSFLLALPLLPFALGAPTSSPRPQEFGLVFSVTDGGETIWLTAQPMTNGTDETSLVIIGDYPVPQSHGGPLAFLNGTEYPYALNFDMRTNPIPASAAPGVYGIIAPLVGDQYGYAGNVLAVRGQQDFNWGAGNGTLAHRLTGAALNHLYACDDDVNGFQSKVLKWGTPMSNGTALVPPTGCEMTELRQIFFHA